jgi:hypothetical protein
MTDLLARLEVAAERALQGGKHGRYAEDAGLMAAAAAEIRRLRSTENFWLLKMAEVREASGIGVLPMLSEVPAALRRLRRQAEATTKATHKAEGAEG